MDGDLVDINENEFGQEDELLYDDEKANLHEAEHEDLCRADNGNTGRDDEDGDDDDGGSTRERREDAGESDRRQQQPLETGDSVDGVDDQTDDGLRIDTATATGSYDRLRHTSGNDVDDEEIVHHFTEPEAISSDNERSPRDFGNIQIMSGES